MIDIRTYKTLDKDLDNYDKKIQNYKHKKKQANKEKKQRIINDIGAKFLNESDININNVHYNNNVLNNYYFIDKDRINKYHQDMSQYKAIYKLLKYFSSNMYTTNEGNHYINQNNLSQLSAWLYDNFHNNQNNNKINDNENNHDKNINYNQ